MRMWKQRERRIYFCKVQKLWESLYDFSKDKRWKLKIYYDDRKDEF